MEKESAVAAGEFCVSKVGPPCWVACVRRRVNVRLEMNVSCVSCVSLGGWLLLADGRSRREALVSRASGRGSGGAQLSKASGRGKREASGIKWEQAGSSGIKWDQMGTRSCLPGLA